MKNPPGLEFEGVLESESCSDYGADCAINSQYSNHSPFPLRGLLTWHAGEDANAQRRRVGPSATTGRRWARRGVSATLRRSAPTPRPTIQIPARATNQAATDSPPASLDPATARPHETVGRRRRPGWRARAGMEALPASDMRESTSHRYGGKPFKEGGHRCASSSEVLDDVQECRLR
jgi:hypothetical protein